MTDDPGIDGLSAHQIIGGTFICAKDAQLMADFQNTAATLAIKDEGEAEEA